MKALGGTCKCGPNKGASSYISQESIVYIPVSINTKSYNGNCSNRTLSDKTIQCKVKTLPTFIQVSKTAFVRNIKINQKSLM